jgi:hypothetical protein
MVETMSSSLPQIGVLWLQTCNEVREVEIVRQWIYFSKDVTPEHFSAQPVDLEMIIKVIPVPRTTKAPLIVSGSKFSKRTVRLGQGLFSVHMCFVLS